MKVDVSKLAVERLLEMLGKKKISIKMFNKLTCIGVRKG